MTTLLTDIDATETLIDVTGSPPGEIGGLYTIGSESVQLLGVRTRPHRTLSQPDQWSVIRGIAGTTKAVHSSGATLTQYYPDAVTAPGGGGVTVDNGTDPPAEVTTIVAPGAVIAGDTATMPYLISIASTGADDAEIALLATAEDGSVDITLNAFSDASPGTMLLSAGSGDTGANIQFLASNGLGSEITLTATRLGLYGVAPTAQSAAIADATDPASTMANLNTLLAYLRLRGDIAT